MNILHYSLGFPPFRRGGMTQYCIDLMVEQIKSGHNVGLLWPGVLRDLSEKFKINKRFKYAIQNGLYCDSYEIINPLPIPLMDGIRNPEMYLIKKGKETHRTEEQVVDLAKQKVYQDLRKRNIDLLESLDVVHFNSSNTLRVYQNRGYSGENACIVSISNGAIQDHKKRRTVKGKLRLGYLGPITTHKGYNLFKGACDEIWNSGIRNFEAHIFVEIGNPPPYMV